jgi:uncharacterized protein (TIGR03067 family)
MDALHTEKTTDQKKSNPSLHMKILSNALALALLSIVVTAAAAAEKTDTTKEEISMLQGEWTMVSGSADGMPLPDEMRAKARRICKGDETSTIIDGRTFMKAKFIIDPAKTPKTIDYEMTEGFTRGRKQLGIYEIKGDTFKSCFAAPGADRPRDFTTKAGDGRTLSTWKRTKTALTPGEQK